MNIGIVTTWFERGAAYVSKQYEELLSAEHDVFIYARGGEEYAVNDPKWDQENVYWAKKVLFPVTTYIDKKDFIKWMEQNNIELVIFNEQRWWEPIFICNEMRIKTVAYIDYYTEETIPFFELYDALICNTKRHLEAFSWHDQVIYIPWGTNIEIFKPKIPIPSKTKVVKFFHSCGMSPTRKGTELLIKAFYELCNQTSSAYLIIHSQTNLEKIIPNYVGMIRSLKDRKLLEIVEDTVSAPGLYYKGDIYVYPTLLEGIGLTIAEAIASGLPTIVPNAAPMNEFVQDDLSGKVVAIDRLFARSDGYYWPQNRCDITDLKEKMNFYIKNIDKINKYKINARKYAEEHLNWSKNAKKLNEELTNISFKQKEKKLEDEIRQYFQKRIPGIFKFKLLYKSMYTIYRKYK